jgi:hypothetical protein
MDKKTKKILENFVASISEGLTEWADMATRLKTSISASSSNIVPFNFHSLLRQIDSKLHAFRIELKKLYGDYAELEETYGLKPLSPLLLFTEENRSLAYLMEYSVVCKEMEDALGKVKDAASKYSTLLDYAKNYDIKIDTYITPHNQKALTRLGEITTEKLLAMLGDINLLGL